MSGRQERRDHCTVLGVPPSASDRQITTAYRRLVRSLHPDTGPADPAAAEELADVLAAYDTLRDARRRAAYGATRNRPSGSVAGRPVAIRVTRRTAPSSPWPAGARRDQRGASGLLGDPDALLDPAPWRIGPGFRGLPLGVDDSGWDQRGASGLLRDPDALLDPAPWRIGPGFRGLPLGVDDSGFLTRILRQWMRETDSWL